MLGTFVQRTAKLGDGLIIFLTDVTEQRRMEAELRSYADVVAHDLSEPIAGIAHARRGCSSGAPRSRRRRDVLRPAARRAPSARRELIDGVLAYARAGELQREPVALGQLDGRGRRGPAPAPGARPARRSRSASCPRSTATRASCAACCRTCVGERA